MKKFIVMSMVLGLMATPALAAVTDLTTAGASGTINGAIFQQIDPQSTGTGVIQSFVRIQDNGTESGYNTDGTLEFDTKAGTFTHSLLLSDVPIVDIDGTDYRQFLLDINQKNNGNNRYLSLDELKIHLGAAGDLTDYPTPGEFGPAIYDLDEGSDNWIKLDGNLNPGSGAGDMFAYIPDSEFTGSNQFVYLYSTFGTNNTANDGFEEWSVLEGETQPPPSVVPVPGAVLLGSIGVCIVGWMRTRRSL